VTVLAAFSASRQSSAPVELAAQIARTTGEQIVAAAVIERRTPAGSDPFEDEYVGYVTVQAERALHGAVDSLPPGSGVTVEVVQARSIPAGLTATATERGASVVTLGSSSSGVLGRVALGSVTERLVHTAQVPVAIAPRGYRPGPVPISRVTAAFGGKADANGLIEAAADLAKRWNLPLRVVSFAVRDAPGLTGAPYTESAEIMVLRRWWDRTRESIEEQLGEVRATVALDVEVSVGVGPDWRAAVENAQWQPGEILLLGSGAAGQAHQVFLGSAAARIVRYSPVPVMIMPRP
jgi:nucleotide-binding universal stress UspA family protein